MFGREGIHSFRLPRTRCWYLQSEVGLLWQRLGPSIWNCWGDQEAEEIHLEGPVRWLSR